MAVSPPGAPAAAEPAAARGRPLRWLAGGVVALLLLAAAAIAVFWSMLHSAPGTAWLLDRVPQLRVVAPRGSLIGDFAAERLDVALPGTGVLQLHAPRWQGLRLARGRDGRWLHIVIDSLHADRVTWLPQTPANAAPAEPARPPQSLRLPLEIEIATATVGELRIGSADATPIRSLRSRVHLGAEGGTRHRLQDLAARVDRGSATGALEIGADAPFPVGARVGIDSVDLTPAWHVDLRADGPLDALNATAIARVQPTPTHAAQSLDAQAVVRPFAPWPLGELRASVSALDLSAFAGAAPATSLSGEAIATSTGSDVPATLIASLTNGRAGRWNEGLLPVRRFRAEVRARPDDPSVVEVLALEAELGTDKAAGGRIVGRGRWTADRWELNADLAKVRPAALDARAPETSLDGKVSAVGTGFASSPDARTVQLSADLAGDLADPRLPRGAPRRAQLRLEAEATPNRIEVRTAEAGAGEARATVTGVLQRADAAAPWQATGRFELARFDPAVWWPGAGDSPLLRGRNRLNGKGEFDLVLPAATPPSDTALALVAATRGKASLSIADSLLAGVALAAEATYVNSDGRARPSIEIVAGGNRLKADGRLAAAGATGDTWQLVVDAPRLATLAPFTTPLLSGTEAGAARRPARPSLSGTLSARAQLTGRWPDIGSEGELHAADVRLADSSVRRATARWRLGSAAEAALDGTLTIDDLDLSGRRVERAQARLSGTARAHRVELEVVSAALPPEWIDTLAARAGVVASEGTAATPSTSAKATNAAPAATAATAAPAARSAQAAQAAQTSLPTPPTAAARSIVSLVAEGGLVAAGGEQAAGWRGSIREIVARSTASPIRTWISASGVRGSVLWSGGPVRVAVEPGSARALGATLRWSRIAWQAGDAQAPARLDVQASVDAFPVAPALKALQPTFGWGGDLVVGARINVRSAPAVIVDAVLERRGGDLTVSDEIGSQALGLTDLRLGVAAEDGVWHFTTAAAGGTLGVVAGAVTARTSAQTAWPDADTPIEGVLELRVANLGTWGPWVPAGWRLSGDLHASASIGGRFGAPQYTGRVEGSQIGVRNFLEGVNITDGSIAVALQGTTARIERFTAKAGEGSVRLEGTASFDEAPEARLRLVADRFEVLGRVDRRIVASGSAALRLDAKTVALDGEFKVDEGLVDFTRSDAPRLGDDVVVVRRPPGAPAPAAAGPAVAPAPATPVAAPASRTIALDLRVGMGERMRVRGRGLDAGLRGELHITSPGGRMSVAGTLSTADGSYQAYGQKLAITRGVLTFVGPVENPRLDIQAVRPDLDVSVGVTVSGTALNPRIRLFSDPAMSDLDKLSWLVLGRESATNGGADTALLQQAALALLSGEGPGVTDRLIQSIGLDSVDIRQSQGAVRDTIVSLGKQISKRWYVGYEHGLNTTTGTWQLIYRVAQRVTIRAQAGGDNAIDVNWTLRWK